jgi:hypothetical protein
MFIKIKACAVMRFASACVFAFIGFATPSAASSNWFALNTNSTAGAIEVDVGSLRWRGDRRELRVRISYAQPQPQADGASYRSILATLQVNCDSGQTLWQSASFHPDARGDDPPIRREPYAGSAAASHAQALIPEQTWLTLRRSACFRSSLP